MSHGVGLQGQRSSGQSCLEAHPRTCVLSRVELGLVLLQSRSVLEGHLELLLLAQAHIDLMLVWVHGLRSQTLWTQILGSEALGPQGLRSQSLGLGHGRSQTVLRLRESLAVRRDVLLLLLLLLLLLDHLLLKLELNHLLLKTTRMHLVLDLVLDLVLGLGLALVGVLLVLELRVMLQLLGSELLLELLLKVLVLLELLELLLLRDLHLHLRHRAPHVGGMALSHLQGVHPHGPHRAPPGAQRSPCQVRQSVHRIWASCHVLLMEISEVNDEASHERQVFLPGLGFDVDVSFHVCAGFGVSCSCFSHGVFNLSHDLLAELWAPPVAVRALAVHL